MKVQGVKGHKGARVEGHKGSDGVRVYRVQGHRDASHLVQLSLPDIVELQV